MYSSVHARPYIHQEEECLHRLHQERPLLPASGMYHRPYIRNVPSYHQHPAATIVFSSRCNNSFSTPSATIIAPPQASRIARLGTDLGKMKIMYSSVHARPYIHQEEECLHRLHQERPLLPASGMYHRPYIRNVPSYHQHPAATIVFSSRCNNSFSTPSATIIAPPQAPRIARLGTDLGKGENENSVLVRTCSILDSSGGGVSTSASSGTSPLHRLHQYQHQETSGTSLPTCISTIDPTSGTPPPTTNIPLQK